MTWRTKMSTAHIQFETNSNQLWFQFVCLYKRRCMRFCVKKQRLCSEEAKKHIAERSLIKIVAYSLQVNFWQMNVLVNAVQLMVSVLPRTSFFTTLRTVCCIHNPSAFIEFTHVFQPYFIFTTNSIYILFQIECGWIESFIRILKYIWFSWISNESIDTCRFVNCDYWPNCSMNFNEIPQKMLNSKFKIRKFTFCGSVLVGRCLSIFDSCFCNIACKCCGS